MTVPEQAAVTAKLARGGGGPRPAYPTQVDQVTASGAAWAADRPPATIKPARRNVARAEVADRSLAA